MNPSSTTDLLRSASVIEQPFHGSASDSAPSRSLGLARWATRVLAGLAGFLVLLLLAEVFLRHHPPKSLHQFLGDDSPISGNLAADPDFAVGFESWASLCDDNPNALSPSGWLHPHSDSARDLWLFLGSSFAYELTGEMRRSFPERRVMNLDRREPINIRMAQVKRLLDSGCRPGHVFLVTVPVDLLHLAEYGLENHRANRRGGLVLEPAIPPAIAQSRLGLTAWCRFNLHKRDRSFRVLHLHRRVPERLDGELARLFAGLGKVRREHDVPITVVQIPAKKAVERNLGFAIEERLLHHCTAHEVSYLDLRRQFLSHPNPAELYVPDGHLSPAGNQMVAREVVEYAARGGTP